MLSLHRCDKLCKLPRDPGTHRQLPGRCGRLQPASEESVPQRCQICNMPKKRIFKTGRELLRLSNVSLFSLLISIFKSLYAAGTLVPSEFSTHILLDTKGKLSPFSKHTETHLSIRFCLCTQTILEEHKRNASLCLPTEKGTIFMKNKGFIFSSHAELRTV